MAQKTSINIKPCNIGSSEAHNRRTAEYLAHISKEKLYVRTDLTDQNKAWISPDLGSDTLTDRYNQIAAMVKEKTGRAMQTKDRERVNKKTGKVTIVRGSTPLKEGVVVIKNDTKMEQLRHFCEVCRQRWGITALQIFIHRDEGHYGNPEDIATWKPNLHAHIVWDWMDHETGKSCKLQDTDMSEMQSHLAECLDMERGNTKEVTGKEHLERTDFIIAKQKQEAEQAKAEKEAAVTAKEEAESMRLSLDSANKEKEERSAELDNEIAEKEKRRDEIRRGKVDSILDSVGSLVGVGKSVAIEKENSSLKAENKRIRKNFSDAVNGEVAKRTKALIAERNAALIRASKAEEQSLNITAEKDQIIRLLRRKLDLCMVVLHIFAEMLYAASEVFKRSINAIVEYASEKYKSIFSSSEAADIRSVMQSYSKTGNERKAIGEWMCDYAETLHPIDETNSHQTRMEVKSVAEGAYDRQIERDQDVGIQR